MDGTVALHERQHLVIDAWLRRFNAALAESDRAALGALFRDDGHWRDIVALSWGIGTVSGEAVAGALLAAAQGQGARDFAVDRGFRRARWSGRVRRSSRRSCVSRHASAWVRGCCG